jgi:hypothetical protein
MRLPGPRRVRMPKVCGVYFAHPESRYFGVGRIERDQVEDYTSGAKL